MDRPAIGAGEKWTAAWALGVLAVYAALALPLLVNRGQRPDLMTLAGLALAGTLAALSAIDVATMRLPNALTLPLIGAGLAVVALTDPSLLTWRIGAAVFGFVLFWLAAELYLRVRGRAGLGLGDAKLLAAAGAWVGIEGLASVVLIAAVTGLVTALGAKAFGRAMTLGTRIPFGPFLALGIWWVWLYGPIG